MGKRKTKNSKNDDNSDYDINHDITVRTSKKQSTRKSNRTTNNNFPDLDENSIHNSVSKSKISPMLADKYDGSQSIDNWYVSEKLDGIRAVWNGSCLYSRNGNIFHPPKFFTETFPDDILLDGELFLERGEFSETVSIVKKQYPHDGWDRIKFLVLMLLV